MSSIPRPSEGDTNIGTNTFIACWVLTGIVGLTLLFRYGVKSWVRFALPQVTAPERVWGVEDIFFLIGYCFDLAHMSMVQLSYEWGLGRHFYYLSTTERFYAMKWDFISQPIAVAAAMISRTGMMWFLLTCFAASDKKMRAAIIICAVVQVLANMVTIVQIIVQCGPNPYHASDRVKYFKYMWTPLPADGSVKCQSSSVQTTIGYVQGGFNTVIDFALAIMAGVELWQFFLRTLHREPNLSFWKQFKKINSTIRSRRIWQTITLCGPLVLSGAASIVKTYKLKSLGDRQDFTHNIVAFVLWVKIENYSILLASCAPVARLFLRTVVDSKQSGHRGYWSSSRSGGHYATHDTELKNRSRTGWMDSATATNWNDETHGTVWDAAPEQSLSRISKGQHESLDENGVTVKTDIIVQVDDNRSTSSGDARLLPGGGEPPQGPDTYKYHAR